MSGFDNREKAEEGRFALEAELEFKARARRNRQAQIPAGRRRPMAAYFSLLSADDN